MPNELSRYSEARKDLSLVISLASDVSNTASGRSVSEWRLEYASYIFTKACLHAISAYRLSPTGLHPTNLGATELWDLPSICAIVRALVDSYFAMYYIAVDSITIHERAFRELLWQFQGEDKRLSLLRLIRSESPEIPRLEVELGCLRDRLLLHPVYAQLPSDRQRRIRSGDQPMCLTNSELAVRAGISSDYYKAVYRFLSSYVHTYPFSVSQLALSRAGDPQTLRLFDAALQYCLAFFSAAIRDFRSLFPDLASSRNPQAEAIVDTWVGVLSDWDSTVSHEDNKDDT